MCVVIDLTAAFDTVSHDTLISKIVGSSLPPAITRWLSCYLRGDKLQLASEVKVEYEHRVVVVYPLPWPLLVGGVRCSRLWSTSQLLRPSGQQCSHSGGVCPQIQGRQCGAYRTGVPQGSKLSPSLFNYYIADMPRPTTPVKRVCYADDITVWATGPKIPQLESMITNYLRDVNIYLKDNSLLISSSKSTNKHQFQMHPYITLEDTQLPLERSSKIQGVILDPSISFHKHCNYVSDRIDKRNNMLRAVAGSSWGQDNETLLMTYNALGKSIANYAAPVWSK